MGKKPFFVVLALLISFQARSAIVWNEVAPGIWKGVVGTPEEYTPLSVAGVIPQTEGFSRLPDIAIPALADSVKGEILGGKTFLSIPLERGEQLYGFGLNFRSVHQRGAILNLHVDHYGGKDNGRTHAPVPFYISSKGYGVLINSAEYLTVYAGSGARKDSPQAPVAKDRNTDSTWKAIQYSDAVSVLVPAAGTEIYLFGGPTSLEVIRRYNLLCGGGVLPPR